MIIENEDFIMIKKIMVSVVLLGMCWSNAVIEKYDPVKHEQFVKNMLKRRGISISDDLNASQLPYIDGKKLVQEHWYQKVAIGLAALGAGNHQQELYVATDNDKAVGFIRWLFDSSWIVRRGWIDELIVDKEHLRHGHGTALVQTVLDKAQAQGIKEVKLTVSHPSASEISFFTKMGFAPVKWLNRTHWSNVEYTRVINSKK